MTPLVLPGLAGRTVVVTGAAGGQGLALAHVLLASGARVVATDLAPSPPGLLEGCDYHALDVASPSDWAALAASLDEVHGLVNNAGIPFRARLLEVELADWHRVIGVNLTGALLGVQALAPLMSAGASIVNIGSAAAVTPHHAVAYTASKWGLRGLSAVAAVELGARGIRCNLVNPGYIETPMMAAAPPSMAAAQLALTPLERLGQAEEVAAVVAFLLSDAAAYVTGAEVPVDGGYASAGGVKYLSDRIRNSSLPPRE